MRGGQAMVGQHLWVEGWNNTPGCVMDQIACVPQPLAQAWTRSQQSLRHTCPGITSDPCLSALLDQLFQRPVFASSVGSRKRHAVSCIGSDTDRQTDRQTLGR